MAKRGPKKNDVTMKCWNCDRRSRRIFEVRVRPHGTLPEPDRDRDEQSVVLPDGVRLVCDNCARLICDRLGIDQLGLTWPDPRDIDERDVWDLQEQCWSRTAKRREIGRQIAEGRAAAATKAAADAFDHLAKTPRKPPKSRAKKSTTPKALEGP
jgi:hypothetical protein